MAVWNEVQYSNINLDRFDAEYFRKDFEENLSFLQKTGSCRRLGTLFSYIKRGSQPKYNENGTIRVLRSVNVGFMNFNKTRQEYVTQQFLNTNARGGVEKNDILVTSTGVGTLGRTSIWHFDKPAYCDGHITILRNGVVDPFMVTAFLNSKYGLMQFDQNYRGSSGQIEIYPFDISKIVIPELLFEYEREIGDYLRKSFKLQKESKKLYSQATELLDNALGLNDIQFKNEKSYTSSYSALIQGKRLDSDHFKPSFDKLLSHIKDNFDYLKIATSVKLNRRGIQPIYISNGTKQVVTSQHITSTHLDYDNFERTSEKHYMASPLAQIKYGDILTYTTGAYVGQTNVYLSNEPAIASNHVNIIRLKRDDIDPVYVAFVMNSLVGKMQTDKHIRGSAQAELYPNDIAKFIIPILDRNIVDTISKNVKESLDVRRKSKQLLKQAIQEVESLIEKAAERL